MTEQRNGIRLQDGVRELSYRYATHLQYAATLTLKTNAVIKIPRFENFDAGKFAYVVRLNDEIIASTIKRFEKRLTHHLYGNKAKHTNKKQWAKPLIFVAVEGRNTGQHIHIHLAVGNIPLDKTDRIEQIIATAWHECDFGNEMTSVCALSSSYGWLDYITKEVGYTDDNAFAVEYACIPEIVATSI